jgi:thioredoxin-dependent peroxiredoxin
VSPLHPHKLTTGQTAPDFSAKAVSGKKITLSKLNARYVLLVFLRYSSCPWCNLAIHRLSLEYPTFKEHDCEVVAFIQSDKTDIVTNIYERHVVKPEFPIIADAGRTFYELYGVTTSIKAVARSITQIPAWVHAVKHHGFKQKRIDGNLFLVPASFLVDSRTHKIVQANYGKSFYDNEAFIDIYQAVFFKEL